MPFLGKAPNRIAMQKINAALRKEFEESIATVLGGDGPVETQYRVLFANKRYVTIGGL